ncbi:RES family NAD+ phosphorylase [Rhodococcus sp. D2-41]|uniref:RES family NAD+ phosphorylase n=1 Tax=Speluncibacter jeojiensis TaxID=2710754 RepID=UPI00240F9F7F|nr:RES family NAD+ phosphorylase [Rhodococcus sp. D2-41]MDG3010609.1 RES family NAD+ phosphorylase [Rhodococcus sp. D2-41]
MIPAPPGVEALRAAGLLPGEVIDVGAEQRIWRVHRTDGVHVLPWNALRTFGPILRFDHHPPPRGEHADHGIWYGSDSPRGALAEAFQSTRVIDCRRGEPFLTALRFTRVLRLLDVSGIGGAAWSTRVGGNHAIESVAQCLSRQWARQIRQAYGEIDGVAYRGRYAGRMSIALFERGADGFPDRPELSLPLRHSELACPLETAAHELGYTVV